ncbi:hypothetical protein [Actinoplanes philippinensis]|uniref:hypothetical protein n=1 Tax=Actinoplanes philippinensis TaxID=35752 RepID=UPI003400784C
MIRDAGAWKTGQNVNDLIEYARAEGAEGYDVHEIRLCQCATCGGQVFGLHGDLEQQTAKRLCRSCGGEHHIADSGEYWDDTKTGIMVCECDGDADEEDFNIAVGFSLYDGGDGIRALAITSRCVTCGRLGYWDDWMIRSGDMHLLDLA